MHKGTVVNLGQYKNIIVFLKNNWCLLTLTISFLIGVTFGIFSTQKNDVLLKFFENFAENFISLRLSKKLFDIFLNSLLINFSFLLLIYVFGTSVTGVTFAPILITIRGYLFGALAGIFYADYSLKGIALSTLILIPPTIVSVIFLIISAREAMNYSLAVIGLTLPTAKPKNLSCHFSMFTKRNLLLIIPLIIAALLDGWLSIKLFAFINI